MDLSAKKIVVLDFDIPQLLNNKIFDPGEAIKVSHTILPTCYLFNEAQKLGIVMMTPDVYLNLQPKPKVALMVSHLVSPFTLKLIQAGVEPVILTCQESPFIASRFYLNLKKYSSWFKHCIVYSGMRNRLSKKTVYHEMFFPSAFVEQNFTEVPFKEKKLTTMISGNKGIGDWRKSIILKLLYGFNVKEIYRERQKVINYMAPRGGFDLYGVGWDKGGQNSGDTENINKVYRGTIKDKTEVLKQYKFAFCFENCVFPGFLTEKLFDVMFANCVPIYFGDPCVKTPVPAQAFLDVRDFRDYNHLAEFLENMGEDAYNGYLGAIKKYLSSPEFYKFTQEHFAEQMLGILEQEFKAYV
jgi:hypothetical protein